MPSPNARFFITFEPAFKPPEKFVFMHGRVMIFDDDTDLLEVCTIVLKSKNYDVSGNHKCNDILRDVELFAPDVILMDNWIPDTGGVKAIQLIKKDLHFKGIPVIFFSANNNVEELALEAGAEFFLQKPFEIDDLENIVSRAIETRRLQ
jgi:two-component system cell cycle response regulator DivK